jgi:hypothetical protein
MKVPERMLWLREDGPIDIMVHDGLLGQSYMYILNVLQRIICVSATSKVVGLRHHVAVTTGIFQFTYKYVDCQRVLNREPLLRELVILTLLLT